MKKLIVFGPTGRTGLAVLERCYNDPELEVTAFLRKPHKVPKHIQQRIRLIIGDVFNADQVANALAGQDVVISSIGTGNNLSATTVISEGLRNILDGMRKHEIKHITVVGVAFLMPNQYEPYILKRVGADHKRAHEILKNSKDIDWICTAPPQIIDAAHTGTCRALINKLDTRVVTTHDLADWMLQCTKNPGMAREYTHQLVGLSSTVDTYTWLTRTGAGRKKILTALLLLGGMYFIYKKVM